MSNAVTISGSNYTVTGTVKNQKNVGVLNLQVLAYDKDPVGEDDFLGIANTDSSGTFSIKFNSSSFSWALDRSPDLYFIVNDGGFELLSTKEHYIKNATAATPAINLEVNLSEDKLRQSINDVPVDGWVGGFKPANLNDYPVLDNMANIKELERQQKVLWPEFSWESEPGEDDPKRCFQMFAPDISRIGYTNEGRVYSIICPQQGTVAPNLGSMNVEITVTGNRGWVDEDDRTMSADMGVIGKIWFAPSSHQNEFVKKIREDFHKEGLKFPFSKEHAIEVSTFKPGFPDQPLFPLSPGISDPKVFEIPDFAKHEEISWTHGHLSVEIGPVIKTGIEKVDKFNQMVVDIFNMGSGNMLKHGNTLTWNVWFTAPEHVDQQEWHDHAHKWRTSIDADYGAPDGPGTVARYFDGSPFKPLKAFFDEELLKIGAFIKGHL
jgi:hypothetical protein